MELKRILIVEDDADIAAIERDYLELGGYAVTIAPDGTTGLDAALHQPFDLILLDVMLPGIDGFAICKQVRAEKDIPILMVTARGEDVDKIRGLGFGADDYIEKPYDIDIMLAKIGGIFKRRYAVSELTDGNIRINKISRTVYKNGTLVEMTSKEFNLLVLLMENKGKALSKEYIFNQIWGCDSFSEQQTLTVHIKWLRQKIEDDPKNPKKILTVWGVGYKYESV